MRCSFALLLTLVLCAGLTVANSQSVSPPLTLPQYIQSLDDSLAAVSDLKEHPQKSAAIRASLPPAWHVEVDGKSFEISTQAILQDIDTWQQKGESESLDRAILQLQMLRNLAVASRETQPDFVARRAQLNSILSRREFRMVHGETWMDRLKQRINRLLLKWLGRALTASAIPTISDIVVYGLMILAVLALAYWMYRSLRNGARLQTIMPVALPVSAKEWPVWMSEARAAAARGEWRDAIHLAYWGGISFLEAQGAWRPDVARTPREYLRLLPVTSMQKPALLGLTTRLEAVWYGMQRADSAAFTQTLVELETLGCPCN
jgi:hypothetical protein